MRLRCFKRDIRINRINRVSRSCKAKALIEWILDIKILEAFTDKDVILDPENWRVKAHPVVGTKFRPKPCIVHTCETAPIIRNLLSSETDGKSQPDESDRPAKRKKVYKTQPRRSKAFKCDRCEKDFAFSSELQRHLITHFGGSKLESHQKKCDQCPFTTEYIGLLDEHIKNVHTKIVKILKEPEKRNFVYRKNLTVKYGQKRANTVKNLQCKICPWTCAHKRSMSRHWLEQHLELRHDYMTRERYTETEGHFSIWRSLLFSCLN